MKKKMLSLFSGCGGMDIGFEGGFRIPKTLLNRELNYNWVEKEDDFYCYLRKTSFETCFANDISPYAKIAWNDYFSRDKGDKIKDVFKVESIVDLVSKYRAGDKTVFPRKVDIVTGGFPCQDFSIAGKRRGFNSHKDHNGSYISEEVPTEATRGKLYMWMRDVVAITKPKIFIAENVKGLYTLEGVKDIIQSDFSNIEGEEYLVLSPRILHSGTYGIPQSRERVFFIGFKKSSLNKEALKELSKEKVNEFYNPYPVATHKLKKEVLLSYEDNNVKNFTKSRDVLSDLKEPEDELSDLSQKYYSKAKFMGRYCQGQKEVDLDKLAPTIRSEHHGNIEYRRLKVENGGKLVKELQRGYKERRLTLRECARIQTFPDDFNFVISNKESKTKFLVSPSIGYKLVGNAVPPLLAYHIAQSIDQKWSKYFDS